MGIASGFVLRTQAAVRVRGERTVGIAVGPVPKPRHPSVSAEKVPWALCRDLCFAPTQPSVFAEKVPWALRRDLCRRSISWEAGRSCGPSTLWVCGLAVSVDAFHRQENFARSVLWTFDSVSLGHGESCRPTGHKQGDAGGQGAVVASHAYYPLRP